MRAAFDVDQTRVLVDYFRELADGDHDRMRDRQSEVVFGWREEPADKIRWIQAFLVHVYHNDILGRRLVVDGVIEAIPADVRADIVRRFCARLGLSGPVDLASYWRRLMEFWSLPETAADETTASLRLALFHRLVNATPPDRAEDPAGWLRRADHAALTASTMVVAGLEPSRGFGLPPNPRPGACVVPDVTGFLTPADVRQVVNAASFLVQEHGVLFNAAFEVRPALLGVEGQKEAVAVIAAFRNDLAAQARVWDGKLTASITVLENDGSGVVGRMVAHLCAPNPLDPADADGAGRTAAWTRAWRDGAGRLGGDAVEVALAPEGDRVALRFHWRKTLDLCARLDPSIEAWDPALGEHRSVLKLLRVKPRDGGRVLEHPLVDIPAPLSDAAVAEACRDRLEPLSAYDDEAWGEITTGWELQEFDERRATRAERERRLAGIRQRLGADTLEARAEVERIVGGWPSEPRRRRRWRGWRVGRPWP